MAAGTKSATSSRKPAAKSPARGNQGNAGTTTAGAMPDSGNTTNKPARKGGGKRGT